MPAGRPRAVDPLLSTGVRLPRSLLARLDAVLDRGETRSVLTRAVIEAEVKRREAAR